MTHDVLSPENSHLHDSIGGRTTLVVMSRSIHRLYGQRVQAYFAAFESHDRTHFMVLKRSESSKSIDSVVEVCSRAAAAGLLRTSPVVAIGGGLCTDICGLAAALHHRGIPHINVPTTLVGLVDAGIGVKNAVNSNGHKSALGSFHPPDDSLLDLAFLATLPRRHLLNGMAEIAKLAIVRDQHLYVLLQKEGAALVDSGFRAPAAVAEEVVWRAVDGMLRELAQNPFEIGDLRRAVDFGHTFSPYIEVASGHTVLHGEAVAMDIALSVRIAQALGLLSQGDLDSILGLLMDLGLPLTWSGLDVDETWASLTRIIQHRDGELHLVIPTGIGRCAFLPQRAISPQLLRQCVRQLTSSTSRSPAPSTERRWHDPLT
jgi:3-dehydroquinate synthase